MSEPLRLLVIEDDPDWGLLLRRHLERAGCTVTACRTGADALLLLGHTAFDLVLPGPHLPDMGVLDFLHTLDREGVAAAVLLVTQNQDAESARRILRALLQDRSTQRIGTLVGGVAHEFNNLLAGINGYAALGLREPNLNPALTGFLQRIIDLSERAAGLTRQMLAFARKPALARQRMAIIELVKSTADLVAQTLYPEVVVDLPDEDWAGQALVVEADANQLQQALVHLAINARDALLARSAAREDSEPRSSPSPIVFRLRAAELSREQAGFPQQVPPGDYAVIEVADRGIGMPADVLHQALDPFFTTKEVGQGTGLGLPMVFGIVQAHHGYLTLDSEAQRGTCVHLYLPRAAPGADGSPSSDAVRRAVQLP